MTKEKARLGSGRPRKTNHPKTNRSEAAAPAKRTRRRARKAKPAAAAVPAKTRAGEADLEEYKRRRRAAEKRAAKLDAALRRQAGDPSASWRDRRCYCRRRETARRGDFVACLERGAPRGQCPHYLASQPSPRNEGGGEPLAPVVTPID